MRSKGVKASSIQFDMEPAVAAAKPEIEAATGVTVAQIGDNVAEVERGIATIKSVCRRVKASLPFGLFGILFVFIVGYAVSRANMWTSPNYPGSLSPRYAFTGVRPNASLELNAAFGDYLRTDATNADTKNDLSDRAVEAISLQPLCNARGEWWCLSLETLRIVKRVIRPGDHAPMPQRIVDLLNKKAAKFSQQLVF
jgi:hypothetical protein